MDTITDPSYFRGKVALVTGATSGIGRCVARELLRSGAKVAVNYHSEDEKRRATEEAFLELLNSEGRSSKEILMVKADVSDDGAVDSLFDTVESKLGTADILVNNAGFEAECPSHELELTAVRKELGVNMDGPLFCCIRFLKRLKELDAKGSIVNVSSVHERIPKPGFLLYSVAKGGMRNLTQTLALEYATSGIRVNAVGPGVVDTKMNDFLSDPDRRSEVLEHVPQRSVIEPEEIARVVLFLLGDSAAHLTGQTIMVDGGLTLYPDFQENWSS